MPEALELVKRELGPEAVILGTRQIEGKLLGKGKVEITAALPRGLNVRGPRLGSAAASPPTSSPSDLPAGAQAFYETLVQSEVAEELARRLARQAAELAGQADPDPDALRQVLRQTIARLVPRAGGIRLTEGQTRRVALVGPAGAGKTTTLAKLAAQFKLRMRKRVAILSLDMQRLGADEQMRRYAEIIGVPLYTAQTIGAVKHTLRSMEPADLLLIDTHGVNTGDKGHFARLAALLRATRVDEVHLVLPASMAPQVQQRMLQRFEPLGVSRVVLTHLDEAVGLGVLLSTIDKLRYGLSYVTDGESVPNHITDACPQRLAEVILS